MQAQDDLEEEEEEPERPPLTPEEEQCDGTHFHNCISLIKNSIQNRTGTGANKVCRSVSGTGPARVPTKYVGQYEEQDRHGCQQSMQVSIQNRTGTGANN